MENNTNTGHEHKDGKTCTLGADVCGCNAGCGQHHRHLVKMFIKLALLVIFFCLAFQMGEMKGMLRSVYMNRAYTHSQMMYGTQGDQVYFNDGAGMEVGPR